mmetsp:Transcript_50255/g.92917  ORF Transcript_50255/g.92917 Transcript_50255/m.92917 type:complete len:115 (-) Transcript_50255:425-769(-)
MLLACTPALVTTPKKNKPSSQPCINRPKRYRKIPLHERMWRQYVAVVPKERSFLLSCAVHGIGTTEMQEMRRRLLFSYIYWEKNSNLGGTDEKANTEMRMLAVMLTNRSRTEKP